MKVPDPPPPVEVTVSRNERMVLERRFVIASPEPVSLELQCTADAEPLEDHRLRFEGTEGELRLYGLLASTRYRCALVDDAGTVRWTASFATDPLPEDLPRVTVAGDRGVARSDDGYTLFTHWPLRTQGGVNRAIAIDGDGRVRWYLDVDDATTGGLVAEIRGGVLVTGGGQGSPPAIRNLSGEVAFQVPPAEELDPNYHHEAVYSPDGRLFTLQGITDRSGDDSFIGFRIEGWDVASGERVWSFDSQPLVDAGILPPGSARDPDPYHANAVAVVPDDPEGPSVWVSLRGTGTLMRIDEPTAQVAGFFGPDCGITLYEADGVTPASPDAWFWGQHAPEFRGDRVLVYDNGGRRPGAGMYSRVVQYQRLGADATAVEWDWTEPSWYEPNFGSAVSMADGHVLVATGHCTSCDPPGDTSWILELVPQTGEVAWRFDFESENDSVYRAQSLGGCDAFANARFCPALALAEGSP